MKSSIEPKLLKAKALSSYVLSERGRYMRHSYMWPNLVIDDALLEITF